MKKTPEQISFNMQRIKSKGSKIEVMLMQEFWMPKIERNMERDKEVTKELTDNGWIVLRFWGKDIKKNLTECADEIEKAVRQ